MSQDLPLLARYAEGLFWMARYLERVENLARLIDVTQTFESPGREAASLVRADPHQCRRGRVRQARHAADAGRGEALLPAGARQPDLDPGARSMRRATNARTLRPLISTEMWMQLNMFHRDVAVDHRGRAAGRPAVARCAARIKEGVQAHTGITEGTFFRDQGWYLLRARPADRARRPDHAAARHPLPLAGAARHRGTSRRGNDAMWAGVLRAAAGYHAFRRVAPPGFTPQDVVRFLLTDTVVPAQRAAVRGADGVAPGAVAQPVRLARHGCRAGTHRGSARRHPGRARSKR